MELEPRHIGDMYVRRQLESAPATHGLVSALPTIFRHRGFRFFYYANEVSPREPVHVHVSKDDAEVKFRLNPPVHVAYNDGLSAIDMRELMQVVENNKVRIEGAWHGFFG